MTKKTWLTILSVLLALPLWAQYIQDTTYIFRFKPGSDAFYVPYQGNETELKQLIEVLESHLSELQQGTMYIDVSSYATTGNEKQNAVRTAYLRNSRVKSELITRYNITESMFLTDKHISTPYSKDKLRDVVVVTFPASLEKIEQIAGKQAAEKVHAYYKDQAETQNPQEETEQKQTAQKERCKTETSNLLVSQPTPEKNTEDIPVPTVTTQEKEYNIALRANLLRWATLTPDFGIEWRISKDWSIQVNGSWTSWSWNDKKRRYALWEVSPEVRYYIGTEKRGYLGAMYQIGEFNYKLSDTGKQGNLMGGGLTGGYQLKLNKNLAFDFSLGIGCTHADYEKHVVIDGVRVKQGKENKNYWGVNHAGITLVWQLK